MLIINNAPTKNALTLRLEYLDHHFKMDMQVLHFLGGDFSNDLSRFIIGDHDHEMLISGSIGREGHGCLNRI